MNSHFESHDSFDALCALVAANEASPEEVQALQEHIAECTSCRQAFEQYTSILIHTKTDIAVNEEEDAPHHAVPAFEHVLAKNLLMQACRRFLEPLVAHSHSSGTSSRRPRLAASHLIASAVAACVLLLFSFQFLNGSRNGHSLHESEMRIAALQSEVRNLHDQLTRSAQQSQPVIEIAAANDSAFKSLAHQNTDLQNQLSQANAARAQQTADIDALNQRSRLLESSLDVLKSSSREGGSDKASLLHQIENLTANLQESRQQLDGLKNQNDELAHSAEEQSKHAEREQRLLATDTDIRDILGARSLHIIDVYDVGDNGQIERPFGRLFYTEGKSLIFYGFDLNKQKGLKTNAVFRAWGEKDQAGATPYSLGAFYIDDKTQNRWVLKFDDNKVLSKIDYVFVTDSSPKIKDALASRKKSLLYAALR